METIESLFDIVRTLRGRHGCAWDRKQTAESMWKCLVEESYELEEALAKNDISNILEELGDVLFQLIFIIEIFQEKKAFTLSDVVSQVALKMIRRHPHVYDRSTQLSEAELDRQWSAIKATEKKDANLSRDSAMDRVPKGMPALMRALNVSKCAVGEGFDWDDIHDVLETVKDEISEFEAALVEGNMSEANLEFGDILFSLVNVARFAKIYPETALADSTAKFEGRFRLMEQALNRKNRSLKELSRKQMDEAWEAAKKSYGVNCAVSHPSDQDE